MVDEGSSVVELEITLVTADTPVVLMDASVVPDGTPVVAIAASVVTEEAPVVTELSTMADVVELPSRVICVMLPGEPAGQKVIVYPGILVELVPPQVKVLVMSSYGKLYAVGQAFLKMETVGSATAIHSEL